MRITAAASIMSFWLFTVACGLDVCPQYAMGKSKVATRHQIARSSCRREWLDAEHGTQAAAAMLAEAAAEEAAAAAALGVRRVGTMDDLRCLDEDLEDRCGSQQASEALSPWMQCSVCPSME